LLLPHDVHTSMIAKTADAAVMRLEKLKRTDFILGL